MGPGNEARKSLCTCVDACGMHDMVDLGVGMYLLYIRKQIESITTACMQLVAVFRSSVCKGWETNLE